MKRRIRKIVNFFAFNLLFFALYLNFIHKDKPITPPVPLQSNAAAYTGSAPVQVTEKSQDSKATQQNTVNKANEGSALKLSIN
jgi:hypothetical protein